MNLITSNYEILSYILLSIIIMSAINFSNSYNTTGKYTVQMCNVIDILYFIFTLFFMANNSRFNFNKFINVSITTLVHFV